MPTIARVYTKRATTKSDWDGRVGDATLVVPDGEFTLNDTPLPARAIEHLMNFALQTLQDAYAGAKSLDEARGNFGKKLAKILDGTIGVRTSGGSESAIDRFIRQVVRSKLGAENKKKYDAIPSDEQDKRAEFLDALFEGLSEESQAKVTDAANILLERHLADVAAKKAAAADIDTI